MDQTRRIKFNIYLDKEKLSKKKRKTTVTEPIILLRANTSSDKLKTQKEEYVTIELLNFQQDAIICMVL